MTNKEKFVKIKKKIKSVAPAIVIVSTTAGAAAIAFYSLKSTAIKAIEKDTCANLLPTITGDEKFAILGRCDLILQKIEDNLYFLSFDDTKTED